MDFNKLIPDFSAIGTTEWGKPKFNSKDMKWLVGFICAALVVVFAFVPAWFSITLDGGIVKVTASAMGIGTWYGILAFIGAIVAIYGWLYERYQFAFWGGVIVLLFALISFFIVPGVTGPRGVDIPAEDVKATMESGIDHTVNRFGAILSLVAGALTAVCAYLKINE